MTKKNRTKQPELVNVATSSDAVVTLQIAQTWIIDHMGKRKTAPELCLLVENEEKGISIDVCFKQQQLNALVGQLVAIGQKLAVACEPYRKADEEQRKKMIPF